MGLCCSRFCARREEEVEPLIIEPTPLLPRTRKWGCYMCPASYDRLHEITSHVALHMPPSYETYSQINRADLNSKIACSIPNRDETG